MNSNLFFKILRKELSDMSFQTGVLKNSSALKTNFTVIPKVNETGRIKKFAGNVQLMQKKISSRNSKQARAKEIGINLSPIENELKRFCND